MINNIKIIQSQTLLLIKEITLWFIEDENGKTLVELIKGLIDIAIMIVVCVFLAEDEDCGPLRTFIWVWTWIIVGVAALIVIALIGGAIYYIRLKRKILES